jgi:hypothetical protein
MTYGEILHMHENVVGRLFNSTFTSGEAVAFHASFPSYGPGTTTYVTLSIHF